MQEMVSLIFGIGVAILQFLGGSPGEFGFGYQMANIVIRVFIQPGLILTFFVLWRLEKRKNDSGS